MKGIGKGLIVGVLAVCLSGTAQGQSSEDGTVAVHGLSVSRADDRLFVSMEMDISDLHVGRDRELVVTPRLVGEGDSLCLPSVLIAGRRRYYHHLRNGVEESTQLYRLGEASVVEYRAVVPYRSWMGRAQLSAVEELRGCCSMPVAVGESGLLRLDLEPRVFVPVYVYLRPQAAPKISVCEGSAYIDFPVSRTELYEDYRRNPEELGKILATIDAIRADEDTRILSVSIKGYASPESPYANNERLARGRTQTLKEYVQRQYDLLRGGGVGRSGALGGRIVAAAPGGDSGADPQRPRSGYEGEQDTSALSGGLPLPAPERLSGTSSLGLRGEIRGAQLYGCGGDTRAASHAAPEAEP